MISIQNKTNETKKQNTGLPQLDQRQHACVGITIVLVRNQEKAKEGATGRAAVVGRGVRLELRERELVAGVAAQQRHEHMAVGEAAHRGARGLREKSRVGRIPGSVPPDVAHRPALKCSYSSDSVVRVWLAALRVRAAQTEAQRGAGRAQISPLGASLRAARQAHEHGGLAVGVQLSTLVVLQSTQSGGYI